MLLHPHHGDLIVPNGFLISFIFLHCPYSSPKSSHVSHVLNCLSKRCHNGRLLLFFNVTRAAQAAVIGAFGFSVVVQWMGLAHYARLISASLGM